MSRRSYAFVTLSKISIFLDTFLYANVSDTHANCTSLNDWQDNEIISFRDRLNQMLVFFFPGKDSSVRNE